MCDPCILAYERAFADLHEFILTSDKPGGYKLKDVYFLANELEIPHHFVQKFFEDSQLKKAVLERSPEECALCGKELEADCEKYCLHCTQHLSHVVSEISQYTIEKTKREEHARSRRPQDSGHRYGLKRD